MAVLLWLDRQWVGWRVQENAAQLESRMAEELKRSALFQEDLKVVVWLWVVMSNRNEITTLI